MSIKHSDEYVWYWYEKIQEFWKSKVAGKAFCKIHALEYNKFFQLRYRIEFYTLRRPGELEKLLAIREEALEKNIPINHHALNCNISGHLLADAKIHLNYVELISRLCKGKGVEIHPNLRLSLEYIESMKPIEECFDVEPEPEPQPKPAIVSEMKFISFPAPKPKPIEPIETPQEVIETQNDLEIIIAKGVKVSISPNIDSLKIIKIIELLKDL